MSIKEIKCDFCIIGTGAAGLYAAKKLTQKQKNVVLFDIAHKKYLEDKDLDLEFKVKSQENYDCSSNGRSFGLGGTTSLWGGSILPFTKADFEKNDVYRQGFDTIRSIFETYEHKKLLKDLIGKNYNIFENITKFWKSEDPYNLSDYYEPKNLWIPKERRNFSKIFHNKNFKIKLSHKFVKFTFLKSSQAKNKIDKAIFINLKNNERIEVIANNFLLCTGAFETTYHIYKLISTNKTLFRNHEYKKVDKFYFNDHLSINILKILPEGKKKIYSIYSKKIKDKVTIGNRYVFKDSLTRSFFHFCEDINESKNYLGLKYFESRLREKKIPNFPIISPYHTLLQLLIYSLSKFILKKVYIPDDCNIYLNYAFETPFSEDRYIKFSSKPNKRSINWGLSQRENESIRRDAISNGMKLMNQLDLKKNIDFEILCESSWKPISAYHPCGSLYLKKTDLINLPSLSLNYLDNLYCLSTALLPSSGTANPTYSLLMLIDNLINSKFN